MAAVRPFRAVRFAPERVDLSLVLAPPTDVDEGAMQALLDGEPRNATRVVAGATGSEMTARRAALHLAEWRRAGVLVTDDHASLYLLRQTDGEGEERAVVGFFGAVRLDARASRDVRLPAQDDEAADAAYRTHLATTGMQTDPVVISFVDEAGRVERVLHAEMEEREPDLRARAFGKSYELWVIDDETATARVARHLEEEALSVVAGAARYRAALALEGERQAERAARAVEGAPASVVAYFVKASGEGGASALLPPRGVVFSPLVALGDDDD